MKITTVGLDLAKGVFQVHAVDAKAKAVLRKQLKRSEVTVFFANLPSCLIGMEACSSAHYLGAQTHCSGPRGEADGATIRQAVREGQQERPQ